MNIKHASVAMIVCILMGLVIPSVTGNAEHEIILYEGWNLISLPFMPEDPSIEIVLGSILDKVTSVWSFNGKTKTWSSYSPGAPSDLNEMVEDKGYWIRVKADVVLNIVPNTTTSVDGYVLRNPTFSEALVFIADDTTDENEYIADEYTCMHFVADFKRNAFDTGYFCYYVVIYFEAGAHAIAAFNTTDRGMLYVDPQDDDTTEPIVGHILYPIWEDDIVIDILLIP